MIDIVCTTEQLAGVLVEADYEMNNWFERDVLVQGYICSVVYPKNCWKAAGELAIAA